MLTGTTSVLPSEILEAGDGSDSTVAAEALGARMHAHRLQSSVLMIDNLIDDTESEHGQMSDKLQTENPEAPSRSRSDGFASIAIAVLAIALMAFVAAMVL
jgi:hypothetical protein